MLFFRVVSTFCLHLCRFPLNNLCSCMIKVSSNWNLKHCTQRRHFSFLGMLYGCWKAGQSMGSRFWDYIVFVFAPVCEFVDYKKAFFHINIKDAPALARLLTHLVSRKSIISCLKAGQHSYLTRFAKLFKASIVSE